MSPYRVSLGRTFFIFRHPSVNVRLQDVGVKPGELFFTNQVAPDSSHLRETLARYDEKNIEARNGSFNVVLTLINATREKEREK